MSDTFAASKASIRRLAAALREADSDTRYDFAFWAIGIAVMAVAIIMQFGWNGASFCGGFLLWAAGNHGLTR